MKKKTVCYAVILKKEKTWKNSNKTKITSLRGRKMKVAWWELVIDRLVIKKLGIGINWKQKRFGQILFS